MINRGDVLGISVWREESLQSSEVLVRPDGYISFPLVGNLRVAGKSVPEITDEIAANLEKFIPDPVVNVTVRALNGNMVYVLGKVARPGVFSMSSQVDVAQALAMAGGMSPYAAANKVRILRRKGDSQIAIPFAYGDIEKGENLEQNILLQAGDVVVVP
jgi:polysaccharide export outer membrane protein